MTSACHQVIADTEQIALLRPRRGIIFSVRQTVVLLSRDFLSEVHRFSGDTVERFFQELRRGMANRLSSSLQSLDDVSTKACPMDI